MSEEVYKSSDGALSSKTKAKVYPFEQLNPGFSFYVSFNDVKESSLRSLVSNTCSKTGRDYFVRKHKKYRVYEVAEALPRHTFEFPIVESSQEAKAMCCNPELFNSVPVGKSIVMSPEALAACPVKPNPNFFAIIEHAEYEVVEIYRLLSHQIQKLSVVEASDEARGLKK